MQEEHPIFMNFGMKKFTLKNESQEIKFHVQMLLSCKSHGMRGCKILGLIPNKATSRSYG
jgi:hypothetical protein